MIDLHSHILPQMDDGSQSVEESQKMLSQLLSQGVTEVFATPHFYAHRETPESFLARRTEALAALGETHLPVHPGAEVAYFSDMHKSSDLTRLQLGNTGLILIEMPVKPWSTKVIHDICSISLHQGLIPVLAHVDRYRKAGQFPAWCDLLAENDVLFQCNAEVFGSFLGRAWARKNRALIHFLGSDCHNCQTRPPKMDLAAKALGKEAWQGLSQSAQHLLTLNQK